MAKIDEIKERINWLKELFKILVMILIAVIAGISKLYLDGKFDNILFYLGVFLSIVIIIWLIFLFSKINKDIKKLRDLE